MGVLVAAGVGEGGTRLGVTGRVAGIVGAASIVGDGDAGSSVGVSLRKGLAEGSNPLQPTNRASVMSRIGPVNRFIFGWR